uniref:Immunoglobulin V-set domain-containing protein n=1 Tax=Fundulus heteroclitus TaxID=8078 RepID=A0A3Q2U993_FUNHE
MYVFFCIASSVGSSLSGEVRQTPADLYKELKQTAKVSCSHNIKNYDRILWYKQTKNKQLEFLAHMLANIGFAEEGAMVKIDGNANKGQTCTLSIESLTLNSSAVYFCAASYHSARWYIYASNCRSESLY